MKDLQLVRDRLVELAMTQELPKPRRNPWAPQPKGVREWMKTMRRDGGFRDINYGTAAENIYRMAHHLDRLFLMARAYRDEKQSLGGNKTLRGSILRGVDFWLNGNFMGGQGAWWYDLIYIPRVLGKTLLMMEEHLTDAQRARAVEVMKRSWPGGWGDYGENLVWLAEATLMRAILERNPLMLAHMFEAIGNEFEIYQRHFMEGIQADFSFHQHGPQLYNGGYGWDFVHDGPRLAWAAHGTAFAYSKERIDVLSQYMLDGCAWMMRRGWLDYNAQGREQVRMQNEWKVTRLIHACSLMADMGVPRKGEFEQFVERLKKNSDVGEPVGNRHFWRSDYMTHHRPGWMTSVKMTSCRTYNTEELRGENYPNAHQGDGVMQILRTGAEYDMILPVLDWRRLPGITCQWQSGPVEPFINHFHLYHKTRFVGGVSDGTWGMAAFDFRQLDAVITRFNYDTMKLEVKDLRGTATSARKTWFFFDREVVCLGANIRCTTDKPVFTSVNQCLQKGKVFAGDRKRFGQLADGQFSARDLRWVHHDGVGYFFPERAALTVLTQTQKGDWQDISKHFPKDKRFSFRKKVFSLWIDHGVAPEKEHYVYAVVPKVTPKELADYAKNQPWKVLANRSELQAVRHKGLALTQAAFYQAGKLDVPGAPSIAVNRPCLVMAQEVDGKIRLSVSNPENEPDTVLVDVGARLAGTGAAWDAKKKTTRVSVDLPTGVYSGQSAVVELSVVS